MVKFEAIKKQYKKPFFRFKEVLKKKKTKIARDSAIKRFEILFGLSWKLIKSYLEEKKGITCFSPKDCFKEAFPQGLIEYNELWLKMTDWRNITVHTYSEKFADKLYQKFPSLLKLFQKLKSLN